MLSLRALLWIDCSAAAAVGASGLVLSASGYFVSLTGFPGWLLVLVGCANILYASYSFSIASAARHSARAVRFLVLANAVWSLVCVSMVTALSSSATLLGMSYLIGEAAFVASLAYFEWRALGSDVPAT